MFCDSLRTNVSIFDLRLDFYIADLQSYGKRATFAAKISVAAMDGVTSLIG